MRIEKSIYLMTEKNISIKEAAELVGYLNMNQFYKYFSRETGMIPAAYLKAKKAE